MKYISLFAGIGGFDLALNRLGHECVWASEWDKYAAQIYDKNFTKSNGKQQEQKIGEGKERIVIESNKSKQSKIRGNDFSVDTRDIRTVPTSEIPDHDLLVGGFPCQAFSIAGKRRGFDDTRGTLFFEIARILKDKKPKFFILENVKGLLSHDNGNTFKTIISTLDELGYNLQWQVLNSKNFGVPQNRERVFIVGHIRGQPRPEVFPITENNSEDIILPTITSRVTADSNGTYVRKRQTQESESGRQTNKEGRIKSDTTNIIGRKAHTTAIRRLTPLECERLQGFPDGWTEEGLSSIMEICVNINPVIEKQLQKLGIALCTTKGGSVMELLNYPQGLKADVSIVVEKPLLVSYVIDTINRGKDMVMLYNQNETLKNEEEIKKNLTLEETEGKSIKKLLSLSLEGNWNEGKLSTILTLIKETIASPTSMFAKIDENIIGVIIHLNKQGLNYSNKGKYALRMVSTIPISDTQRYKCLGNAVTVNVVYEVARRLNG